VSLSPSATHAGPGQTVTFTVDVAALAPATGTPTGTVTIYDGANPVATAPLATGTVAIPVDTLPSGAQSITASYTGDGNFDPSTSAATTVTIT